MRCPLRADLIVGCWQQLFLVIRICVSVVVGAILTSEYIPGRYEHVSRTLTWCVAVTNFGYKWEVGAVTSHAAYKPLVHDEVKLSVGLHVGLRAINVTLHAEQKGTHATSRHVTARGALTRCMHVADLPASLRDEIIDYNEHFSWTWDQGRFGFGPFGECMGVARDVSA